MTLQAFLRRQLDRDPLEHGRLFVAACAAVCAGYFVYMGAVYAGLPPQDTARESGFALTVLSPVVLMFALPIGFGLAVFAYALSLLLPRPSLQRGWLLTFFGVLGATAVAAWAFGPLAILQVPVSATALTALSWLAFPARTA